MKLQLTIKMFLENFPFCIVLNWPVAIDAVVDGDVEAMLQKPHLVVKALQHLLNRYRDEEGELAPNGVVMEDGKNVPLRFQMVELGGVESGAHWVVMVLHHHWD